MNVNFEWISKNVILYTFNKIGRLIAEICAERDVGGRLLVIFSNHFKDFYRFEFVYSSATHYLEGHWKIFGIFIALIDQSVKC